jgi:hypothetical protein
MKLRITKEDKQKDEKPKGPSIYRRDPATDLWKGEDGYHYRLNTHGTKPPRLDLQKEW